MRAYFVTVTSVVLALAASCRSTPAVAPAVAAGEIAEKLAAGETDAANRRFGEVDHSDEHREVVYSVLYTQSQERYGRRDYASSEQFLRFLVEHYPKAEAPREALLYTLFLGRRAGEPAPPPEETLAEMEQLLSKLDQDGEKLPVWRHLVAAQVAVDRGRNADARTSLARFRAAWSGSPPALRPYVEEIDRYLATHTEENR